MEYVLNDATSSAKMFCVSKRTVRNVPITGTRTITVVSMNPISITTKLFGNFLVDLTTPPQGFVRSPSNSLQEAR